MPVTSKQRELGRHWVTPYLIGVSTLDAHFYLQIGDQSLAKLFGYIIIDLSTWKWLLACRDCFLSLSLHSFPNTKVHKTMIVYLSVSFWEMCLLWIHNTFSIYYCLKILFAPCEEYNQNKFFTSYWVLSKGKKTMAVFLSVVLIEITQKGISIVT